MHSCRTQRASTRHDSAFTLVELLVVIVIIAVLVSLSFVMVKNVRDRANNVKAVADMRQIGASIATYMADKGRLPRFSGTGVSAKYSTANPLYHASVLQPYLGLSDPTSKDQFAEVMHPPGLKNDNMSGKKNWYDVTCYAMYSTNDIHKNKAYFPKGTLSDSAGIDVGPFGRTGTGGNPSSEGWTNAMMDSALTKFSNDNVGKIADTSMVPAMLEINAKYPTIKGSWPWPVPQLPIRKDHINVLYFDWHVGSVNCKYFYTP